LPEREEFVKVAIQGELGSNSHMAALAMLEDVAGAPGAGLEIAACATSAEVFERVVSGAVDGAVLPIENSLHGPVAEHYDLLLAQPVRIARESLLRVRHNLIVRPGVAPDDVKRVMSHPVALSQCRRWLAARPWLEVVNFLRHCGEREAPDGRRAGRHGRHCPGVGGAPVRRRGAGGGDRGPRGEFHAISSAAAGAGGAGQRPGPGDGRE
jgi:hypothetical protein